MTKYQPKIKNTTVYNPLLQKNVKFMVLCAVPSTLKGMYNQSGANSHMHGPRTHSESL